jgi:MFS family permease
MSDELVRPGRAWAVTAVATAAMTVSYLDRQVLAVLAPTITAALSISDETYGWLASAFSLAYLFSAPWAGRWRHLKSSCRACRRSSCRPPRTHASAGRP